MNKRKGGAEKERKRKKKKLKEIAAKCMNIQKNQHQSVNYHDEPASDLVNQNCPAISIPPVSKSKVQTVYTDEPELDSFSQDDPEVCSVPLTQVLESQCQQSVNLDPAISDSKAYSAISAQVSEVQRD